MRPWFRRKPKPTPLSPVEVAPVPEAALAPTLAPAASAEAAPAPPPASAPLPLIRERALKTQATATDARAERLFTRIRSEMDDLRGTLDSLHSASAELMALDIDAVAGNPAAAAALSPAVLVQGLVAARASEQRLRRRIEKVAARNARLEARVQRLRQERQYLRGRMETFDAVIGALHENLEDLRIGRDAHDGRDGHVPIIEQPAAPRVLRPGAPEALSGGEHA